MVIDIHEVRNNEKVSLLIHIVLNFWNAFSRVFYDESDELHVFVL